MPFGRHRGTLLSELPSGYVDWLGTKLAEWREPFRSALVTELARRTKTTPASPANGATTAPARRGPTRRAEAELPAPTVCAVCGLAATTQRPLMHRSCAGDEVPF